MPKSNNTSNEPNISAGKSGAGKGNGPGNAGGWPSTTGNLSGKGRSNNFPNTTNDYSGKLNTPNNSLGKSDAGKGNGPGNAGGISLGKGK